MDSGVPMTKINWREDMKKLCIPLIIVLASHYLVYCMQGNFDSGTIYAVFVGTGLFVSIGFYCIHCIED